MAKLKRPTDRQPPLLSDHLRQAIASSGMTLYRVAKDAEVPHATLWRFVHGQQDLNLSTADKLANLLVEIKATEGEPIVMETSVKKKSVKSATKSRGKGK